MQDITLANRRFRASGRESTQICLLEKHVLQRLLELKLCGSVFPTRPCSGHLNFNADRPMMWDRNVVEPIFSRKCPPSGRRSAEQRATTVPSPLCVYKPRYQTIFALASTKPPPIRWRLHADPHPADASNHGSIDPKSNRHLSWGEDRRHNIGGGKTDDAPSTVAKTICKDPSHGCATTTTSKNKQTQKRKLYNLTHISGDAKKKTTHTMPPHPNAVTVTKSARVCVLRHK